MPQNPQILPASGIGMKAFIEQNGWVYYGDCGCANKLGVYKNQSFPQRQIWMNEAIGRMEIRQTFPTSGDRDTKPIALAGKINFEHIYKMFFE